MLTTALIISGFLFACFIVAVAEELIHELRTLSEPAEVKPGGNSPAGQYPRPAGDFVPSSHGTDNA